MRMIVVDERTDLQGLRVRLLGEKAASENALERLQSLNPHVNFKKIPAGTVLLIPDLPGLRKGESESLLGSTFLELREQLTTALDAASRRVREGYEALAAQQKEVSAAIKSAAFKRALETDPELREQVVTGTRAFKEDQEQASHADEMLKALRKEAAGELAVIAKLLG